MRERRNKDYMEEHTQHRAYTQEQNKKMKTERECEITIITRAKRVKQKKHGVILFVKAQIHIKIKELIL